MIKTAMDRLLELQQKPEDITITKYGNYSSKEIFGKTTPGNGKSFQITEVKSTQKVSNIESFIASSKEELKRRDNVTGKNSTASFTLQGGTFTADDDFVEGICHFSRTKSQQWERLASVVDSELSHEQFLKVLQSLKASMPDFNEIYRKYVKIRIIGASEVNSSPIYEKGEAESGYKVKYTLDNGGAAEETFPSEFKVLLPYSKGSESKYELTVETLFLNTEDAKIRVRLICPEFEKTEETAIFDEKVKYSDALAEATELLILENY